MNIINFLYHSGIINDDGGWDERPIWEQQDKLERFAELIIKECAMVVHAKTGPKSALNILEHFGVEE